MDSDLIQLAENLVGHRVLLVGDLMLDRYLYGDAERMSPEAPVPVLRAVDEQERVGGAGSVAANLRALGTEVYCCGMVGDDPAGQRLSDLLNSIGVNCTGVMRTKDRPTTTKTRFVGLAQHRHRQQLLRFDRENPEPISEDHADFLMKVVSKVIDKVDVVCIEDYNKGLFKGDLVARIVAAARRAGKQTLIDPAAISDFSRYRGATCLTPNRNELAVAAGNAFDSLDDVGAAAARLAADLELDSVVVTVDRDGALLARAAGTIEHIPTKPRAVYDNTGAGDAVLATLAAAVAAGADFKQAVQMANVAGGLEVEKFGCVPITRDEVLAELRIEHHRRVGKLRSLDDLLSELTLRRDRGQTVAFTNGCFDILHRGHVEYLAEAAEHADVLVVGLNTDDSVRRLGKGDDRPINAQEDRAAVLGALEAVDYVVLFDEDTPEELIRAIKPNVLVKGEDWKEKGIVGAEFVEANGGKVVLAKLREGFSTTKTLDRIQRD
jgi:D-beta-D-heptose 7-phosphate kinase/D-beta-D-heptose 1-phosphate adenosyltransferase